MNREKMRRGFDKINVLDLRIANKIIVIVIHKQEGK